MENTFLGGYRHGDITVVRAVLPHNVEYNKMLLVLRPLTAHKNPGKWEHPGGQLDQGDADEVSGVIREFREETGIQIRMTKGLSLIDEYVINDHSDKHGLRYIAYAGMARWVAGAYRRGDEHIDEAWVTPEEAEDLHCTRQAEITTQLYQDLTLGVVDYNGTSFR